MYFHDRTDAGKRLATALAHYKDKPDTIVLALPRGGVPVAYEIAQTLNLPLDLMLVRKLGLPGHEELAMGAIANGHVQVLNDEVVQGLQIPESVIAQVAKAEHGELERRDKAYRQGNPPPVLQGKTVILVDDGCATGSNMKAAVQAVAKQHPVSIVVAVLVASASAYDMLRAVADEVICLDIPEPFYGVGAFYRDFSQTSDAEVKALLKKSHQPDHRREKHA
ncbi:MAG: phosphoribosyltransferase [Pseudomonadota bacterium]|nr:phosphoribosyltransferase [Pseudomonadota bacterium]